MMRTVFIILDITFILLIGTRTCGADEPSGPISAKTKDADRSLTINLSACEIKVDTVSLSGSILQSLKGEISDLGPKGDKGDQGERGHPGLTGAHGPKGDKGDQGERGYPGYAGLPGMMGREGVPGAHGPKGDKGDQGERGYPGYAGLPGMMGERGEPGFPGMKGERGGGPGRRGDNGDRGERGFPGSPGQVGPPGISGLNAVCEVTCPPRYNSDEVESTVESEDVIGSQERPSDYPCYMIRNEDKDIKDKIWVFPGSNKFEVKCKGPPTHHTCLILPELPMSAIQEKAFYSREDQTDHFWMSNYFDNRTNIRFDLTQFYNNINKTQLSWLRNKTKQVTQTIRYHCKNSHVMGYFGSLELYSWNDVRIGPNPSDYSPLFWTVLPGDKNECTPDSPQDEWRYTDITVRGSTDRLPIIDFHINDNRPEDQYFNLELRELCFG